MRQVVGNVASRARRWAGAALVTFGVVLMVALVPWEAWADDTSPSLDPSVTTSVSASADPSVTPSPSDSPTPAPTESTSTPPDAGTTGICTTESPCVVALAGRTEAWMLAAGSLTVGLLGALLVSTWGRDR